MTDEAISPLRRRLIEDMAIRRLGPKTQYQYLRHVKRFAHFVGRSVDKATTEDVHRYQLWLASIGTTVPTVNVSATALRFFFKVTLRRHDLAEEVVSTREPRRLPVVLSSEEVGRLLASATNIKHKALLSLAYATGLRASEVVSLKLTDIDSDRMVIRVEQGKGKKDRYGSGRDADFIARPPQSGRIEARTGLRMMPTSPRSPLSFRTAGFPQYGWKDGISDGAFPTRRSA